MGVVGLYRLLFYYKSVACCIIVDAVVHVVCGLPLRHRILKAVKQLARRPFLFLALRGCLGKNKESCLKRQHSAEANTQHGNDNHNDNDDSGSRHILFL